MLSHSNEVLDLINRFKDKINPNCHSDMGVALSAIKSCIEGSLLNIKINLNEIKDKSFVDKTLDEIKLYKKNNKIILNKIGTKFDV